MIQLQRHSTLNGPAVVESARNSHISATFTKKKEFIFRGTVALDINGMLIRLMKRTEKKDYPF